VKDVHCLRVAHFEKVDTLSLNLDHLALRVTSSPDADRVALVQSQLIHNLRREEIEESEIRSEQNDVPDSRREKTNPLWQVDSSFVGDEFEHSDVSVEIGKSRVCNLKRDGELDIKLSWRKVRPVENIERA
jgi:hypothetical protein